MVHRTVVGLHIPKCAGTTILDRVCASIPRALIYQNTSLIRNFQENNDDAIPFDLNNNFQFVWGHSIHEQMLKLFDPQPLLITGLREPIARLKSEIRYKARLAQHRGLPQPDLDRVIQITTNPICQFLVERFPIIAGDRGSLADRAMNVITACDYVYFTENFETSAGAIFEAMGIAPPAISSNLAPEGTADAFAIDASQHASDIELYRRAWDRYRTISPDRASSERNRVLERFRSTPFDRDALRRFIWEAACLEYNEWGILPAVIQKKRQQLQALEAEISYYEYRIKQSRKSYRLLSRLMNWPMSTRFASALPAQRSDSAPKVIKH
jgi:hypothetical protein